jgi:hypothetical protein
MFTQVCNVNHCFENVLQWCADGGAPYVLNHVRKVVMQCSFSKARGCLRIYFFRVDNSACVLVNKSQRRWSHSLITIKLYSHLHIQVLNHQRELELQLLGDYNPDHQAKASRGAPHV